MVGGERVGENRTKACESGCVINTSQQLTYIARQSPCVKTTDGRTRCRVHTRALMEKFVHTLLSGGAVPSCGRVAPIDGAIASPYIVTAPVSMQGCALMFVFHSTFSLLQHTAQVALSDGWCSGAASPLPQICHNLDMAGTRQTDRPTRRGCA